MKTARWLLLPAALFPLSLAGCLVSVTSSAPPAGARTTAPPAKAAEASEEEVVHKNLADLSPEDRKLAEEQKYCAVQTADRLGEMGTPFKVMVKGQPVFLCCDHCKGNALKDPDKTLAAVARLKRQAAEEAKKK
jgi:hypothetical protein